MTSNAKLDPAQKSAVGKMNQGHNVFLTGNAGTGKSYVTSNYVSQRRGDRSLAITATTGIAALNLREKLKEATGADFNCTTIYRWGGIGLGPKPGSSFDDYFAFMRGQGFRFNATKARILGTTTLVIDEISMLPGFIFDFLDFICREIRDDDRPFGGIQVIAVGDFLQLPPVAKDGKHDWAFQSDVWQTLSFENSILTNTHRQKGDSDFVSILNEFRTGSISKRSMAILKGRIARFPDPKILRLFTHNTQVDKWNLYQLNTIESDERIYQAETRGPQHEVDFLKKNLLTPSALTLKIGARVMITANLSDLDGKLFAVNGDLGTVVEMLDEEIVVELDNSKSVLIEKQKWTFDPVSEQSGEFNQFPLRLAWAITIHKSQGLTLESAIIDIRATREPGQAYVAASRCRSLNGLFLKDIFKGVWVSGAAKAFHARISKGESLESISL